MPIHAAMQVPSPIPGGRRSSAGGVHLILTPLGALGWVVGCAVVACQGVGLLAGACVGGLA